MVKRILTAFVFLPCQVPEVMFPSVHSPFLIFIFPQERSNQGQGRCLEGSEDTPSIHCHIHRHL